MQPLCGRAGIRTHNVPNPMPCSTLCFPLPTTTALTPSMTHFYPSRLALQSQIFGKAPKPRPPPGDPRVFLISSACCPTHLQSATKPLLLSYYLSSEGPPSPPPVPTFGSSNNRLHEHKDIAFVNENHLKHSQRIATG